MLARAFSFFPSLVSVVVFQCLIGLCLKQVFAASSFRVSIPYKPVIRVRGLSGSPPLLVTEIENPRLQRASWHTTSRPGG